MPTNKDEQEMQHLKLFLHLPVNTHLYLEGKHYYWTISEKSYFSYQYNSHILHGVWT